MDFVKNFEAFLQALQCGSFKHFFGETLKTFQREYFKRIRRGSLKAHFRVSFRACNRNFFKGILGPTRMRFVWHLFNEFPKEFVEATLRPPNVDSFKNS